MFRSDRLYRQRRMVAHPNSTFAAPDAGRRGEEASGAARCMPGDGQIARQVAGTALIMSVVLPRCDGRGVEVTIHRQVSTDFGDAVLCSFGSFGQNAGGKCSSPV